MKRLQPVLRGKLTGVQRLENLVRKVSNQSPEGALTCRVHRRSSGYPAIIV